ncbi:MAG: SGNH/GDSL hydrolase family protein [Candidatus Methylomirabilia bacterium]
MGSRIRSMVSRSLLSVLSIGLTAAMLEGGLRITQRGPGDPGSIEWYACHYDPILGWKGNPHLEVYDGKGTAPENLVYATNAAGYNDREWPARRPGGVAKRIVVLGDSFAYGFGVHFGEAFPHQLELLLGGGTQVSSFGIPGYSTDQELLQLRDEALLLRPDLVLVGLFMDDIFNNGAIATHEGKYPKPYFEIQGSELLLKNVPVPDLRSRSALIRFLKERFYRLRTKLHVDPRWRTSDWLSAFDPAFAETEQWRVTLALLARMNALCAQQKIRFAVVVIPFAEQVSDPQLRSPQEVLRDFGRRESIPVLDLLPHFENRVDEAYLENDLHWTARGHQIAAQSIAVFLEREGLLR